MNKILDILPLSKLIADGEVHQNEHDGVKYVYVLRLSPTIIFSYGTLDEDKIAHWYEKRFFTSSSDWLSYCRAIVREPLVKRKILAYRQSVNQMRNGLGLLKLSASNRNV